MKPSIRVIHSSRIVRPLSGLRWIYLGKAVEAHRWTRQCFGAENEWLYDDKLRETAEELRQPFLDFVAAVGAEQKDPLTWWSTRFSWKMWTASDLFLLICYSTVAQSCIEEARQDQFSLLVVVEDPWLLRQIQENLRITHPDVLVKDFALHGERLKCLLFGLARRLKWLLTVTRNHGRQKRLWPNLECPVPASPAVGIFSYPSQSAFEVSGQWRDAHLPGLDRFLTELGLQVVRFCPPEFSGWEKELAERSSFAYPLILWATGRRVFRSLCAFWWPRWPNSLFLKDHGIRWLCLREWWQEIGLASLCAYRLYYECLQGMLSKGSWRHLITFYENQPWEKLQVLAARAKGVKTVGIQINTFSRFYLSYGLGLGEETRLPLPDTIGSSGEVPHRLLMEYGIPSSSIQLCGALRYPDLVERLSKPDPKAPSKTERSRILVVLPIDPVLTRHLLEALVQAFPDGGAEAGLHFVIRPHPIYPIPRSWVCLPATLAAATLTNLQENFSSCGLVLFTASTVGFEALAEGKAVLRYRSPRLFDLDEVYGTWIPVVSDSNLRAQLLACVQEESLAYTREDAVRLISASFRPVDRKGLLALFRDNLSDHLNREESPALAESTAQR